MRKALNHLKQADPVLADIIQRVGPYRMTYREPVFGTLARAIVFQQLSTKAATTIFKRLLEAAGGELTPDSIRNLSVPEMRAAGLSKQKIGYIRDLAEHAIAGELDMSAFAAMEDQEIIDRLTSVKGIGVWTAHMFLIFALKRPNVLPTGDLGVRKAMHVAYRKRKPPSPKEMEKMARNWHPYRSIASWYLWRSLDLPRPASGKARAGRPV